MRHLQPADAQRLLQRLFDREDKFMIDWLELGNTPDDEGEGEGELPPSLARINAMICRVVYWKHAH